MAGSRNVPSSSSEQQLVLQHQELRSLFHMSHQLPARIRDYSSLPEALLSSPSNHIKYFAQASYFLLLRLYSSSGMRCFD